MFFLFKFGSFGSRLALFGEHPLRLFVLASDFRAFALLFGFDAGGHGLVPLHVHQEQRPGDDHDHGSHQSGDGLFGTTKPALALVTICAGHVDLGQ